MTNEVLLSNGKGDPFQYLLWASVWPNVIIYYNFSSRVFHLGKYRNCLSTKHNVKFDYYFTPYTEYNSWKMVELNINVQNKIKALKKRI